MLLKKEWFDEIWTNCINLEENHFMLECITFLAPHRLLSRTLISHSTPPHRLSLVAPIHPAEKPRDSFLGPVTTRKQ